jgi:uncharacterized membrane protein
MALQATMTYQHPTNHDHHFHPFGADAFGRRAEKFARLFGTPTFLLAQTFAVGGWIVINAVGLVHFDLYPFILLNLAFSLQAAYAAPLILLAQTRGADRDRAQDERDARHREAVAARSMAVQHDTREAIDLLHELVEENTELTRRIEALTSALQPHPEAH